MPPFVFAQPLATDRLKALKSRPAPHWPPLRPATCGGDGGETWRPTQARVGTACTRGCAGCRSGGRAKAGATIFFFVLMLASLCEGRALDPRVGRRKSFPLAALSASESTPPLSPSSFSSSAGAGAPAHTFSLSFKPWLILFVPPHPPTPHPRRSSNFENSSQPQQPEKKDVPPRPPLRARCVPRRRLAGLRGRAHRLDLRHRDALRRSPGGDEPREFSSFFSKVRRAKKISEEGGKNSFASLFLLSKPKRPDSTTPPTAPRRAPAATAPSPRTSTPSGRSAPSRPRTSFSSPSPGRRAARAGRSSASKGRSFRAAAATAGASP